MENNHLSAEFSAENNLTKTFQEFVQIPSPTGAELEFSCFLKSKLEDLGLKVYQDERANLFTRLNGHGEPVLLVAHLDTVGELVKIKPIFDNGIFKSDGTTILGADNKASVTVIYELIKHLKTKNIDHRPIEVLFSVAEEAGISGIDTFDFSKVTAKEGLCIDAARPVGTVILSSPFYLRQTFKILGKPADSSNAQNGQDVLEALSKFIEKTKVFYQENTLFNIGIIKGGTGTNILLSEIELEAELRAFCEEDLTLAKQKIKDLFEESCIEGKTRGKYHEVLENQGYVFNKEDSFVNQVTNKLSRVVSQKRVNLIEKYWGVSDVNNINAKGIKMVNLGYGAQNTHTVFEKVALRSLVEIFDFLINYLK